MKEHKKKERLDVLLVKRGLAESREKAKAIIMTGNVFVKEQREDKAGSTFDEDVVIEVKGAPMKYVSRGGYKLEKAMELWQVPLADKVCMDVGSSTGGFTDCMLQNGALKVYAIDVGTNQLAWKLRQDERVISMEKTNIRYVTHEDVPDDIGFSSIDVAFISLTKVLVPVRNLLASDGQVVCLIKPQFEAGKDKVGKKGVVRDKKVHLEVVRNVITYAIAIGFKVLNLSFSPIKGPEGNIEYLLYIEKNTDNTDTSCEVEPEDKESAEKIFEEKYAALAEETVEKAHQKLDV
ncbi:TlyA family RNA methyltransferase [Eubacterium sp. MSJ-13]|uniref:TlyA family RNA methyltransferase n=1 Tax=Eubacterium sp. MSJ-13 TaxID=2841513 RepID=UPI001C11B0EA|nr:TlyA family RNA methyltransferase [Eubacterium sp. MSJ-13]MBU5479235.1 TlyA family RNA methyltransferase [Eubacterium sp. MSJ-13]